MLQYIKFGQNPSFGSRDTVQTAFFGQNSTFSAGVTLKMRSRSPKSNHVFSPSQCVSANVIKIHSLVQETECRQEAMLMRTQTGSAPKEICPPRPPLWLGRHNETLGFEDTEILKTTTHIPDFSYNLHSLMHIL